MLQTLFIMPDAGARRPSSRPKRQGQAIEAPETPASVADGENLS